MSKKKPSFRKEIIKQLYFNKTFSCTGISNEIGKSIPFTGRLIDDLVDKGYLVETGLGASTGGRRPLTYSLKDDILFVAVVVIDQYITRIAVMDVNNQCVGGVERMELDLSTTENYLAIITEKLNAVIERSGIEKEKFAGIGIGIPGGVSSSEKIYSSFLNSQTKSVLTNYISQSLDLPVFINTNASLISLAELRFGVARKRKNAVVINIGWSFELSLILNGELFRGTRDATAESSHHPLFLSNILCECGKTGGLNAGVSLDTIIQKAIKKLKAGEISVLDHTRLEKKHPLHQYDEIVDAIYLEDQFAMQLFSEAGYAIGRALVLFVNLLHPELIVLSGKASPAGRVWKDSVQSALNDHCIRTTGSLPEVQISSLGQEAELVGAATLVMENFERNNRDLADIRLQMAHH